ncbi:Protein of unknown function [Draconibacterium orientale]|jgi:hypothetical protein|uniref:DUF3124 domain-containing protein n=1 Tax=Draconibacterium orientale TaxID=1168034 RepID=X5DXS8_9BACT|nr:DUF3124 domain-containing protein [Draconibacterium orientale]AHW59081.1 hypothetical protein FH5T_04350 [Draconibacterium orientale]SET59053.1 Protein of unknown function [Draconibacterium orientale]
MKQLLIFVVIIVVASACKHQEKIEPLKKVNWENRKAGAFNPDSLQSGTSYLSVYSQIYSGSQERLVDLTATISMRNPNASDTLYISSIDYYNTKGDRIRSYLSYPVFILPMETVEIIIEHRDNEGGTGANVIFNWSKAAVANEPVFEAVMISTYGQMGLSFVTHGTRIY